MDKDEFIKVINQMGYEVDGTLDMKKMGAEIRYEFFLRPIKQDAFNWNKCNDGFLDKIKKVANMNLNRMDFTNIKELVNRKPTIIVVTTGLLKVVRAIALVNKKLPYSL